VELAKDGEFGKMVSYQAYHVDSVTIEEAVDKVRRVDPDGEVVNTARAIGICMGD
jgi:6-phosphofructokinase 1